MSETKTAPPLPKPPTEVTRDIPLKSPYKDPNVDDTKKGLLLGGMTKKQRMESGLGWLKAHDEVDYKGYEVKKLKPAQHKITPKGGFGGGFSSQGSEAAPSPETTETADEQPPVSEAPPKRSRVQEAEALSKKNGNKEAWIAVLSSVAKKIGESLDSSKPTHLDKEELALIEIFLTTAQNKLLLVNTDLGPLIVSLKHNPTSPSPPNIHGLLPELNEAWFWYDSLDNMINELRKKAEESEIGFDSKEVESLDRVMGDALDLFPTSPPAPSQAQAP